MNDLVTLERRASGRIVVLTIDNPPVNALSVPVRTAMLEQFAVLRDEIERHASLVKVVVIQSALEKGFSAGADLRGELLPVLQTALNAPRVRTLHAIGAKSKETDGVYDFLGAGHLFIDIIAAFPIYTIAVIKGYALGGGLELALACDERLVTHDAQLGLPEVKLDLLPGWGGTVRSADIMGTAVARGFYEKGEPFSGCKAVSFGLASKCFDGRDDALAYIERIVRQSAASPLLDRIAWQKRARPLKPVERAAEIGEFLDKIMQGDPEWEITRALNGKRNPRLDEATGFLVAEDGTVLLGRKREH